ncbi:TetR/AcrR family transcriptional regulator [Nocardiopsis sp. N85]|uniref:TetR/AcrR family transcriptional regulator n=1 Tax=Nocardiopsis sp. N85 TaxID=3029400 RepID=UPI00237F7957|nr:TetR/AcrR family transcriptional regulator [Nocardiopsis sp. N85]MDE3721307.1 TetR/AcrR family transcriptional regulator [Nocardiopsis sp. N85]
MSDRERDRPRMTKGERTRQRIIEAATELFSRSGYRAVSLRDIAAQAGLTHAGLLHHFPSKEAMLIHVLSRRDEVDAPLVLEPDLTPERLISNIIGIVERNVGTPGLVSLYVNLSAEATDPGHPAHTYFFHRYRILREHLVGAFSVLLADLPGSPSPETAAQQFLAVQDGLQIQWLLEPETVDMRAGAVAFLRYLGIDVVEEGPASEGA